MAREIYCARCGKQLAISIKALPQLAKTMTLIEPHECGEMEQIDFGSIAEIPAPLTRREQDKTVSGFPFAQHIDENTAKLEKPNFDDGSGDRRPDENKRVHPSIAPEGLREMALGRTGEIPSPGDGNDLSYNIDNEDDDGEVMGG
jgi:hypothetical protein